MRLRDIVRPWFEMFHIGFVFDALVDAYFDCRRMKHARRRGQTVKPNLLHRSNPFKLQRSWFSTQRIPDFASRYFTEDIDYGLKAMVDAAKEKAITAPSISNIYNLMSLVRNT